MQATSGLQAADFLSLAGAWLQADPVANNVICGIAGSALTDDAPQLRWVIAQAGPTELVGAAACTPPYPVVVTARDAATAVFLADNWAAAGFPATGVTGPVAAAEAFADRWQDRTAAAATSRVDMCLYHLDRVTSVSGVPGRARVAEAGDRALLVPCAEQFLAEVELPGRGREAEHAVESRLHAGRLFVWEHDGRLVAMTGTSPPVAGITRIGLVYTPPAQRRRGYAGALVAAVSAASLAGGATGCMLYAETANATSNGVYRRIGYRPAGRSMEIGFA